MTLVLNKATTVLPVDDAERARHFYADTLGLPHRGVADDGSELFGSEGGPMLQLMPVKDGMHSEHTTLSFEVSEIERTVQEMEAKGVMFQDYDLPGSQDREPYLYNGFREVRLVHGLRAQYSVRAREHHHGS